MVDPRLRIGRGLPLSPEEVAARQFAIVRRGYDQAEVRAFLRSVSGELTRLEERITALEQEVSALSEPPPVKLDVETLTAALGEETARVLRTAQEAAMDLKARAEEGAARTLSDAHEEAARVRGLAESLLAERTEEAEAMATKLRTEAEADIAGLREKAESEATQQVQEAIARGKEMVGEAQAARERMLSDLARRRKAAVGQLEALRAGRERLLGSYAVVRRSLEEITSQLGDVDVSTISVPDVEVAENATVAARAAPPTRPSLASGVPSVAASTAAEAVLVSQATTKETHDAEVSASVQGDSVPVSVLPSEAVAVAPSSGQTGSVDQLFAELRSHEGPASGAADSDTLTPAAVPGEEAGGPHPGEAEATEADEAALVRRDEIIDPLAVALVRRLKRILQDEQNLMLDRLRTHKGKPRSEAVLPDRASHARPYVEAAANAVAAAEQAGVTLAGMSGHVAGGGPDRDALDALVDELTSSLVDPLRQRLERALAEDGDGDGAADLLSAAYRDVKVHRIEHAVGDLFTGAITLGVRHALASDTPVRWIVDDPDGPCPDCDDNSLAGATALGQPFPTGQLGPPAHPGCRCLLVPVPA